jgi:Uma2 family endonuclease
VTSIGISQRLSHVTALKSTPAQDRAVERAPVEKVVPDAAVGIVSSTTPDQTWDANVSGIAARILAMSLLLEQDQVILHGVSWLTFQQLLADRGESGGVLLAYDRGTVELRMPSQEHEWGKTTLTQVVEAVAFACDLHYRSLGSTTFERADLARAFEPDACFYLDHADVIAPDRAVDLTVDPPPDLVIEVDITRASLDKLPIYAALRVPEVWRYADRAVEIRCLAADAYTVSAGSRVLTGITAGMVTRFVDEARATANQTARFKSVVAAVPVVRPGGTA